MKFDFLGLKTLTVIQNADRPDPRGRPRICTSPPMAREIYTPAPGAENDINAIPLDDEASYKLYASAKTVAVFQVESSGMMDALQAHEAHLHRGYRGAGGALPSRPDGEHPDLLRGQERRCASAQSIHPLIDDILEETQGIIVYQEQVMQIAQVMAGYSLGGADLLRRAMGKKIAEEMAKERPKFEKGAMENGVDKKKATEVFDLLEKFANYGFNKSHAAAYAVVSYQTAWLKANHPVEFMAGVMNCDIHLTDKLAVYVEEVRKRLGSALVPPCVNRSDATFKVVDGALVYALGALKNVGVEAMKLITDGAWGTSPLSTLFDLARRVDLKRVGKRPLEMLARSGAFDELDPNRRRVFGSAGRAGGLFRRDPRAEVLQSGLAVRRGGRRPARAAPATPSTTGCPHERLGEEFKAVGFYLSGHPLDDYMAPLKRKGIVTLDELMRKAERAPLVAKLAGVVAGRQERKSARGNRFAFCQMSDTTGAYEVTLFSETLEKSREHLETGAKVVVTVEASMEADQLKLLGRSVAPIDVVAADVGGMGLKVFIDAPEAIDAVFNVLEGAVRSVKVAGRGPVQFCLMDPALPGEVEVDLGQDFPVTPQIKGAIKSLSGVLEVEDI